MTVAQTTAVVDGQWYRVPDDRDAQGDQGFIKWNAVDVGFELEGTWTGAAPNRFGEHGTLTADDGSLIRFGLPKVLAGRLGAVETGRKIKIVYMGGVPLKNGKGTYHTFDVYSDAPVEAQGAADDTPF